MGFGLPAAIGAQVANPDKIVLLVDGDGSFNMTNNDLGTIKEHQLPIKMVTRIRPDHLFSISTDCSSHFPSRVVSPSSLLVLHSQNAPRPPPLPDTSLSSLSMFSAGLPYHIIPSLPSLAAALLATLSRIS